MSKLNMREALSESLEALWLYSTIMVPSVVTALLITTIVPLVLAFMLLGVTVGGMGGILVALVVGALVLIVIEAIIFGMYPPMTRDVMGGKEVDLIGAFREVTSRAKSLIGASMLIALIVILLIIAGGTTELVVASLNSWIVVAVAGIGFTIVGVIFAVWFWYVIPAVMLSDASAVGAISTSKSFTKGKFWGTFLFILTMAALVALSALFTWIPSIGRVIQFLLLIPISALWGIVPSYIYLKYSE